MKENMRLVHGKAVRLRDVHKIVSGKDLQLAASEETLCISSEFDH